MVETCTHCYNKYLAFESDLFFDTYYLLTAVSVLHLQTAAKETPRAWDALQGQAPCLAVGRKEKEREKQRQCEKEIEQQRDGRQ